MSRIYFDVGANNGHQSVPVAANEPNTTVYAFEPTPEMIGIIESRTSHFKNYNLIKKAVSNYEGKATFNVAGQCDWGCSSLLEFSDRSKVDWPGRTDFVVTQKIEVEVIRLDKFVKENSITKIDYLHIDTQGSDLNVLKGLGEQLSIVQEGAMEAASKPDILYFGQNTQEECVDFLISKGFEITRIEINDPQQNEVNIYFKRVQ